MAKVTNTFLSGRMNSDVHYSLIDNKEYVYALNLRPSGYGKDGAMHAIKGSKLISDFSENGTMTVVGMFAGSNSKLYTFLARRDGLSKIIETDVITHEERVVIQDRFILRFDLIRWSDNIERGEKKYILDVDQIGDLLFFSSEEWEYPRVINLKRDYSQGFTIDDIILAKKPPKDAPKIIEWVDNKYENNDNDTFVSFAYRYKYLDGDYSSLSFYSTTAFEPKGDTRDNGFSVDSQRTNKAMVNKYDTVKLMVESGGKNVTEIEVYAREHKNNTAYLIYSVNKKQAGIPDNNAITDITYKFSKNYQVLDEDSVKMLYSNIPKYPKTQTAAGNRMIYGNYKEGFDLISVSGAKCNIDFKVFNNPTTYNSTYKRNTAISMFRYKVGVIFYNDYNESTTVLLPIDQTKSEVEITFADRFTNNNLTVEYTGDIPQGFTKMKFAVNSQDLNYENIFFNYIKRIGKYVYLHLEQENINKVNKGDVMFFTNDALNEYREFTVINVSLKTTNDGFYNPGTYAEIIDKENYLTFKNNDGEDVDYKGVNAIAIIPSDNNDNTVLNNVEYIFNAETSNFSIPSLRYIESAKGNLSNFQLINGDELEFEFGIQFWRNVTKTGGNGTRLLSYVPFKKETLFIDEDYSLIEFLKEKIYDSKFNISGSDTQIRLTLTTDADDLINTKYPDIADLDNEKGFRIGGVGILKMKITKGLTGGFARTKNKEALNDFYFETEKTYRIINGKVIPDSYNNGTPVFDIGFYNGYSWGNGVESYKIKDGFNQKELSYKFRGNLYEKKGYKQIHRKYDLTYSGLYNHELGINNLSVFNPSLANWKTMPIHYGEIQRIISTDGDITVFCIDKVINQYYGKSILADLQGNENVAITNEVLGGYQELPYTFGTQHPESVVKSSDGIYFVDQKRTRYLFKTGRQIFELNPEGSGHHNTGVNEIKKHSSFLSYYNSSHGEVFFGLNHGYAVVFNPQVKGFSHYYNYSFDYCADINGKTYTAYKGKVYEDESTDRYNVFAGGQQKEAVIKYVVNPELTSDKVFQAMYIQSNTAWDTKVKTNLTASEFSENVYTKKESYYYTEIYRDNATNKSMVGAGRIQTIDGNSLRYKNDISNQIAVGDILHNQDLTTGSEITNIQGNTITIADSSGLSAGDFTVVSKKYYGSYRPGGVPIRGEWMEVTLSKSGIEANYITAVNTEIIKSFR